MNIKAQILKYNIFIYLNKYILKHTHHIINIKHNILFKYKYMFICVMNIYCMINI